MSEDIDSRRDDSDATAPAPRVAVEPTPQAPAGQAQPGSGTATPGAATQPPFNAGNPYAAQTQTVAHTVVKTKTKKLPVFLCSLAGMVVGAVLVVALIMTGALNVNRDAGTATATSEPSGGSQTIKIDAEDTTLAEAVSAKALPSVVSITAWSSGSSENVMQGDDSEASGSIGSGVVLDTDGNILTNNHVVEGATDITVSLNGESYEAELVGADTSSDLAVIKLKDVDAKNLTPIEVGDSDDLSVGEWVMAIGSPFGNEQSVSTGIVSSLYRSTALPSVVAMFARGMVTLEGLLTEYMPNVNMVQIISAHIKNEKSSYRRMQETAQDFAHDAYRAAKGQLEAAEYLGLASRMLTRGQLKINAQLLGSEAVLRHLGSIVDRMSMAIVIAGLFIGSSVVYYAKIEPVVFGIPVIGFIGYLSALILALGLGREIWRNSHVKKR